MKKDLINRYIWLVDTINAAGSQGISYNEISKKWERNEHLSGGEGYKWRTFMNHKNDILDIFGIEILCRKSSNTYYIADEGLADASGFMRWLMDTMSVNNQINESAQLKNRIILEENPSGRKFLSVILEAMRDNLMLTFTYKPYWLAGEGVLNLYNVEPYALKVFHQRWYLLAKYGHSPLKIYALDRMIDVDIEFNTFVMPADFDAEDFFLHSYGVIVDSDVKPQTVRLKVDSYQARYFSSLPLHHSQKEEIRTEEYSVFSYYLSPAYDFIHEVFSKGDSIEVLEPKELRQQFLHMAYEVINKNK